MIASMEPPLCLFGLIPARLDTQAGHYSAGSAGHSSARRPGQEGRRTRLPLRTLQFVARVLPSTLIQCPKTQLLALRIASFPAYRNAISRGLGRLGGKGGYYQGGVADGPALAEAFEVQGARAG